ncbi:MAG: hypothetical protein MHPSP_002849, partial [Paramarteilia canceri]
GFQGLSLLRMSRYKTNILDSVEVITKDTHICPVGYWNAAEFGTALCIECEDYKSSSGISTERYPGCFDCRLGYKKNPIGILEITCRECDEGFIAVKDDVNPQNMICKEHKCSLDEFYDFDANKCVQCTIKVENSTGRVLGSMPLVYECRCPESFPKIAINNETYGSEKHYKCLDHTNLSRYHEDSYLSMVYKINEVDTYEPIYHIFEYLPPGRREIILFKYCHDFSNRYNSDIQCLCAP